MMEMGTYERGFRLTFALTAFTVFIGSWIYCILTYDYLLGVGFGWVPSIIVGALAGFIAGLLWPLLAAGVCILLFLWAEGSININEFLNTLP